MTFGNKGSRNFRRSDGRRTDGQTDGQTDGRTDGRTDVRTDGREDEKDAKRENFKRPFTPRGWLGTKFWENTFQTIYNF